MPSSLSDDLIIKQIFPNSKIEKKLGEGSFGIVYKVNDSDSDKTYAVKIIKTDRGSE